jgi:2-polyprenyl-3-methyl-5-hydroxy-6-metoxy-1,4-benzoquinol methylase
MDPGRHWDHVYSSRACDEVSWYEPDPVLSLELIHEVASVPDTTVIDVGAGESTLVERLLDLRVRHVAVLDVSSVSLAVTRARLSDRAAGVTWIEADVTRVTDIGRFDIWHDRAAFHFLADPESRRRYAALATRTIRSGGYAIIATFALDGPQSCSGLPVVRYDADALAAEMGPSFEPVSSVRHSHATPSSVTQNFLYTILRRREAG